MQMPPAPGASRTGGDPGPWRSICCVQTAAEIADIGKN